MKFRYILGLAIIVLVCVNWFDLLEAQTLSDAEIKELKENPDAYHQYLQKAGKGTPRKYTSPDIYNDTSAALRALLDSANAQSREARSALHFSEDNNSLSADSIQHEQLRPFGWEVFANSGGVTVPSEIPNSDDYVLGPQDNLLVFLWGRVEREYDLTIDREGNIQVPPIGEISAWGQTLAGFEVNLRRKLSAVYTDFDLNVTLGAIRSIRVYVIGEVKRPGAYTVSSLTTLFNALYQAGGPNERGSMRKIRHMRNGEVINEIDLYDFLITGVQNVDPRLESGDAIFVPVVQTQVAVRGEVRRPAIYELVGEETALNVITMAGGATSDGYMRSVSLERVNGRDEAVLMDLNLDSLSSTYQSAFTAIDGDRLTVRSVYDVKKNYVAIAGMVKYPGRFERDSNLTLQSLIAKAQLKPNDVYYDRINVFRTHKDNRREAIEVNLREVLQGDSAENITLMDRDSIHIYAIDQIERQKTVVIEGEVRYPGEYILYEGMRMSDLLFLAGNLKRAAYLNRAELAHTDSLGEVTLSYVDLGANEDKRITLEEDDRIYVRQIPEWELHRRVEVTGEVKFPGEYSLISRDETLWDLIQRAGGFTNVAFPTGLALERESLGATRLRRDLERVIASTTKLEEDSLGNVRESEQVKFDANSLKRIVLDMNKIIASNGEDGDITLQPGDRIFVPQTPPGITVLGAVGASGTIKYEPKKKLNYYMDRAGGYTKQADKDAVKLAKADGRVYTGSDARGQQVELGDAIIVPTEIKKDGNFMKSLSSVVQVISGLATSVFIITKL